MKSSLLVFTLLIVLCGFIPMVGMPGLQIQDLYFHKVFVLDSNGQKIYGEWEIRINGERKLTYITDKDTQDIIVTADTFSTVYISYKGREFAFHLTDLNLTGNKSLGTNFDFRYEYNVYLQLPRKCYAGIGRAEVKNIHRIGEQDGFEDHFGFRSGFGACEYQVYFLGNMDAKQKKSRKYRRLKNVYR